MTTLQHSEWVFWVTHVKNQAVRTQNYSTFNRCIVTREKISIENHPSIEIDEIQECDHALITRFRSIHTKIILKGGKKIEIAVADPYYPNFTNRNNASEAFAFKEIINKLIAGEQPNYLRSPYDRARHKAKFYPEGVVYDPYVSPLEYYNQYRRHYSALEIIVKIAICLIALVLLLLLISITAHYLGT